jgi:2,4-dienoyl-CoA reductase-like NADH-dependent reductase (Old Yellow Enzyme family)
MNPSNRANHAVFQPGKIGPLELPNRTIRAAAFEGMAYGHTVTDELIAYHESVAKGGTGMTTVAYAAVSKTGLSFPHQLWMRKEIVPDLRRLTDRIHAAGAKASVQLGHCGNMADKEIIGGKPLAPTGGINWYGPTFPKTMSQLEINEVILDFQRSVLLASEAGFDAIEIHAGHGYLISQFLSPYTNKRKDDYGGSFENRSRFMREVLHAIKEVLPEHMAFIVKMNCSDGFASGITHSESLETARMIEACGAHALVVSGGFVSKAPMFVLRGKMPIDIMAYYMKDKIMKFFVKAFGGMLIKEVPFKEGYFLEEAKQIQNVLTIPVIAVGGMNSMETIDKTFQLGFDWIQIARALIHNPSFVNDLKQEVIAKSGCTVCNFCIAKMYSEQMACHFNEPHLPVELQEKIARL